MENGRIRSKHGDIGASPTPGNLLSILAGITCPQSSATMTDSASEVDWNDSLGPDLNLEGGIMNMQGMTRARSSPQERPVDQTMQASATQSTPRFLHPTDHSSETEHGEADSRVIPLQYRMKAYDTWNRCSVVVYTERMVKIPLSVRWRKIPKTKYPWAETCH